MTKLKLKPSEKLALALRNQGIRFEKIDSARWGSRKITLHNGDRAYELAFREGRLRTSNYRFGEVVSGKFVELSAADINRALGYEV